MRQPDRQLVREIAVVVLVKLVALAALWWCCVRDARTPVDTGRAADRLAPAVLSGGSSAQPGETRAH